MLKPAKATPLSCINFIKILREAGSPDKWRQEIHTENLDIAGQMVRNPRLGFFIY